MINSTIYLLTNLLEAGAAFYYFDRIFVRRRSRMAVLAAFLLFGVIQLACLFLENPILNVILSALVNVVIIYCFYEKKIFHALFHAVLLVVLMAVSELLAASALGIIENYYDTVKREPYIIVIYFAFSKITYVLAVFLVLKFITKRKNRYESGWGIAASAITIFSSLLVIISFTYIGIWSELTRNSEKGIIAGALIELLLSVISVGIYEYTMRNNERINELQLEVQSENDLMEMNRQMADLYENQRIMVHDIKNHLKVIQEYAVSKRYPEMEKYLDNLVGMPALNRRTNWSSSNRLNVMLGRYGSICEGKRIAFCVDIQSQRIDCIPPEDMTALFGNLLDNAIEAAEGCDDSLIEVIVRESDSRIRIGVNNSCMRRPVFNEKNELVTYKQERWLHGFGVKSIRKIVGKFRGEIDFSYDEMLEIFKVSILLEV